MNGKPKAAVKARQGMPPVPSPTNPRGVRPIYANNLGLSATLTDFTLLFLETGQWPGQGDEVQHNELVAAITLPPLAAAGLIEALKQYMKAHNDNVAKQKEALAQAMKGNSGPQ